jgi:hypothetical protein
VAEAHFDYGVYSGEFEAYLAWVVPGADAIKDTQHLIGQSYIELDGDRASVESHVFSYHRVDMGEDGIDRRAIFDAQRGELPGFEVRDDRLQQHRRDRRRGSGSEVQHHAARRGGAHGRGPRHLAVPANGAGTRGARCRVAGA